MRRAAVLSGFAPPNARVGDGVRAGAGRPRDPKVDGAILKATLELLASDGYRLLSVDRVAKRAGISRTTLRLRWKSKAELVFDALAPDTSGLVVPDTGALETDLRVCVANAIAFFRSAGVGGAFQGLVEDCRHQPKVRAALLERVNAPTLLSYDAMLARARARGEAGTDVDPQTLLDIVAGAVLYRTSVSTLDLEELERQLVQVLAAGIRRTADPRATTRCAAPHGAPVSAKSNSRPRAAAITTGE
jgi:AcrR family transcriptional regulator